jgi:hypothetical protein
MLSIQLPLSFDGTEENNGERATRCDKVDLGIILGGLSQYEERQLPRTISRTPLVVPDLRDQ